MIARVVLHFGSQKDVRHINITAKEGQTKDEAVREKINQFGRLPVPPSDVEYAFVSND